MVQVDFENVSPPAAQRRFLAHALRRCEQLGAQVGQFALRLTVRKRGRFVELDATVDDRAGHAVARVRQTSFRHAVRELARQLHDVVHAHAVRREAMPARVRR